MTEDTRAAARVEEITLFDLLLILHRRRRLIFAAVGAGILLGGLLAFLSPVVYRARTLIIPSAALAPATEIGRLSDFRAAASQFGLNLGSGDYNPSVLFPQFLGARDVLTRVLERSYDGRGGRTVNLVSELGLEGRTPDATLERTALFFRAALTSTYDLKTGVTTISLTLRDPALAANVLNAFVEEMDTFAQSLRSGRAGQKVRFVSQRLEEIQGQLTRSEAQLTDFRLRNRQIAGAPQLMLEESRLLREVRLNEELFLTLKTQLEIARIEEFRSLPDVIVVERAYAPLHKSGPRRARLLALFTFAAGFLGLMAAFALEFAQRWARWPSREEGNREGRRASTSR